MKDDYNIMYADNGMEALDLLRNNVEIIDAVFLDIIMPVMDGFELLEKIRKDSKMRHMPIVITSQGDIKAEHMTLKEMSKKFNLSPASIRVEKAYATKMFIEWVSLSNTQRSHSILILGLSRRITNYLINQGISLIEELELASNIELLKLENIGEKSVKEVREKLAARNYIQ